MRPIYLEIDGKQADLPTNLKGLIKLTQAQNALADIDTRTGEYSFPLTLPVTRRNCAIFGQKQHPQALDKFEKTDYEYSLRVGGEQFRGTFRLSSIKNGFIGNLLGQGYSWALAIGDKKLTDLRFPPVSYDGSQLERIMAMGCTETDLQFPLVSYGNFFIPPYLRTRPDGEQEEVPTLAQAVISYPLSVDDYYPGVYYRNVLLQIFADAGWHVQGSVLDEPELREHVLTAAGSSGAADAWPWGAMLPASGEKLTADELYSYYGHAQRGFENNAIAFDEELDVCYWCPATQLVNPGGTRALTPSRAEYTAPVAGVYGFSAEVVVPTAWQAVDRENTSRNPYWANFGPVAVGLVVFRGGEGYSGADGGLCRTGTISATQDRVLVYRRLDLAGGWALQTGTFSLVTSGVYLEPGDVVRLCFFTRRRYSQLGDGVDAYTRTEIHLTTSRVRFACTSFDGPQQLQPAAFLPPLLQKDVVRDFLLRTNSVPIADHERRVVTLLRRDEQRVAAGPALDLSALVDPDVVEHVPTMGAGVGVIGFYPAESEDPLLASGADVVQVPIGTGSDEKQIRSLFAPVAMRNYRLSSSGTLVAIPTATTKDVLEQNCSEVEYDLSALAPRLVRYRGIDPTTTIPFQLRQVPLAVATWDGLLSWSGEQGAVERYYSGTIEQARRGHVAKFTAALTPTLYRQLTPGREVWLFGAQYGAETTSGFDPADEVGQTSIELLRLI